MSLSSGYHPQTNGQTERANQDLEAALRCVAFQNPSSWSIHLPWVEYAHNSQSSAATGMSPFECAMGFQPPLFPAQEDEISVPSVQAHLRRCRKVWRDARAALLRTVDRNRRIADRHRRPAPNYQPGQTVWLSSLSEQSYLLVPREGYQFWPTSGTRTKKEKKRPHTDWWKEEMMEFNLLSLNWGLCFSNNQTPLFT